MPISQIPDSVTCVLTSCGRFDLLSVTLDSFLAYHRPARFIIAEDSADAAFADRVRERYPQVEVRLNEPRLGQHRSIDSAYGDVATPFIFHMEDDFRFDGPVDAADAVALAVACLAALLLWISESQTWGWTSATSLVVLVVALYSLFFWVVHSIRTLYPLVNLRVVRRPGRGAPAA